MLAQALAMARSQLSLLSLILFPLLPRWMFAITLPAPFFWGVIWWLLPKTPCESMLYLPHVSALLAYNGCTSVSHGPINALFLEPDFVPNLGTLNVGHGHVATLFLGLGSYPVPMLPCEAMLYWLGPHYLVATESSWCFVDSVSHRLGRHGGPDGSSSFTYCSCIAKVLFFSKFQNFFHNFHILRQKNIHMSTAEKVSIFPYNLHNPPGKKKHTFTTKKYTTRRFFSYKSCIFLVFCRGKFFTKFRNLVKKPAGKGRSM